jgi:hypothetical protein
MSRMESSCYSFSDSHKHEQLISGDVLYANFSQLKLVLPYIEQQCTTSRSTEYLKLGDQTIIHTFIHSYAYRTFYMPKRIRHILHVNLHLTIDTRVFV